jgi:hypothetical protein
MIIGRQEMQTAKAARVVIAQTIAIIENNIQVVMKERVCLRRHHPQGS